MKKSCRLYGGPFDGDTGEMDEPLPNALWAYRCPDPKCNVRNGIHWQVQNTPLAPDATEYKKGPHTGVEQLYVWADLTLDGGPARQEQERVPAGGELVPV